MTRRGKGFERGLDGLSDKFRLDRCEERSCGYLNYHWETRSLKFLRDENIEWLRISLDRGRNSWSRVRSRYCQPISINLNGYYWTKYLLSLFSNFLKSENA